MCVNWQKLTNRTVEWIGIILRVPKWIEWNWHRMFSYTSKWSNKCILCIVLNWTNKVPKIPKSIQMAHLSLPWPPQPPSSQGVACVVHPPSWHLLHHSLPHNGTFLGSHCPIPLLGSLIDSQEWNESMVFVVIQGYSLSFINYIIDQMMSTGIEIVLCSVIDQNDINMNSFI